MLDLKRGDIVALRKGERYCEALGVVMRIGSSFHSHFEEPLVAYIDYGDGMMHSSYDIRDGTLRIWVLRHNQRRPSFGIRRFGR